MKIKQSEQYEGQDWWKWSVWLDGQDTTDVEKVTWRLHPSFPQPVRECTDAADGFRIDTAGWGAFTIKADVQMKDGTTKVLEHDLELHYPDGAVTDK